MHRDRSAGLLLTEREVLARSGRASILLAQAGEDVAAGFGHARTIYTSRAESKMQAFLYCFLPINILLVGGLLLIFFLPQFAVATDLLYMIDGLGGY